MRKNSRNFSHYPLLILAICFATGIFAAHTFPFDWIVLLIVSIFSAFAAAVFISKRKVNFLLICFSFFSLGAFSLQVQRQTPTENRLKNLFETNQIISGDPFEIEGVLQANPELSVEGFFLQLRAEKAIYKGETRDVYGTLRLFAAAANEQTAAEYSALDLRYGSRIRVACRLKREDEFLNPGAASKKEILDQKQIDATGIIKSPLLIEKIEDRQDFAPLAWIYERRQNLILGFEENFSRSTAGIMIASLLGNKYFLEKQTAEVFREGGTFHVLVISGLHITFIGGLTLLLLRFFTKKRFWQFVIAGSFLWIYSIAVGAEIPVVRAAIMFTILLFSQVISRYGTLLNALGACGLILLVWRPEDLFSQSFHLTFASVTAIIAMAFPLIEKLREIGSWMPSAEKPFPPKVSVRLRKFCETLYWRQEVWNIKSKEQIWSANLFKSPYLKWTKVRSIQGLLRYVFEALLISGIVQIWLLPFLVVYFHRVSIAAVLLNLWVGFFIALESFSAVIALFFAQITKFLALPIIYLTEIFNSVLLFLPNIFIENNWASMRVPIYSGNLKFIYVVYFLPIIILTFLLNNWKPFSHYSNKSSVRGKFYHSKFLTRAAIILLCVCFGLILFHPYSAPLPDGRLRIDFLDVGQGDSALVTFTNGETLLIDGGGRPNYGKIKNQNDEDSESFEPDTMTIGESVVSEFLWEKGYSKIDYILATHADADHIQGLNDAAKNFRVKTAFFGKAPENNSNFTEFSENLNKRKIDLVQLSKGDEIKIGEVKIEVLLPETDNLAQTVSENNNSLVLRLTFGAKTFLLAGDIERESEIKLLQSQQYLTADVVKVPHHGSRTSSREEFVRATRAKFAVISVGESSPFGHPHSEVVERWKNSGAKVLKTGSGGTISFSTDGRDLQLETFRK